MQLTSHIELFTATLSSHPAELAVAMFLLVAAVIDVLRRRIPNWLTVPGALVAIVLHASRDPSAVDGLLFALGGLGVGLLTLPLWLGGMLGAGDVKLLAMTGAFLGPRAMAVDLLYIFVAAGISALVYAGVRGGLARLVWNVNSMLRARLVVPVGHLPYGVSVALGTLAFLATRATA